VTGVQTCALPIWSAERGQILIETLHDVVLGDGVEEVVRLAAAAERPELGRVRELVNECGREIDL
jgi:hypothetical protein